jgi:hypothetical protein
MSSFPRYPAAILRYSPECVEGEFSELRPNGVLRSSDIFQLLLHWAQKLH